MQIKIESIHKIEINFKNIYRIFMFKRSPINKQPQTVNMDKNRCLIDNNLEDPSSSAISSSENEDDKFCAALRNCMYAKCMLF